jgi:hypothetical protein
LVRLEVHVSHILFEALDNAGLTRPRGAGVKYVHEMSPRSLFALLDQIAEITAVDIADRDPGLLAHAATLSLGGGPRPCSEIGCRLGAVNSLARFAALYSDRVYVFNPLPVYLRHPPRTRDVTAFQGAIQDDILVLQELRPLVASGHVAIVSPPSNYCSHCLAKHVFGVGADKRFADTRRQLRKRFLSGVEATLECEHGVFCVTLEEAPELLEHSRSMLYTRLPRWLRSHKRVIAAARRNGRATLTLAQRRASGIHLELEAEVFNDLLFEMSLSQALGTSFLADSDVQVSALTMLSGDKDVASTNRAILAHLTAMVPFAGDVPIADLLTLRNREEEAFSRFRASLAKTVSAVVDEESRLSSEQAKKIYHDVLRPGLADLDLRVSKAKRDLIAAPLREAAAWTGALGFGMYFGLLPATLFEAATALGLVKTAAEVAARGLNRRNTTVAVREHELYYLWKVREGASSS